MFHNGRHRTILLTKFADEIPIAIDRSISGNEIFKNAIIKKIEPNDVIELPDYPIKKIEELRG
jgi:hypothetical protein